MRLIIIIFLSLNLFAAEHNLYHYEVYDDVVNPTLKLNSASMGGFMDVMKSYIVYTAIQNVPGTKSLGLGITTTTRQDHEARIVLPFIAKIRKSKALDFYIEGKVFCY